MVLKKRSCCVKDLAAAESADADLIAVFVVQKFFNRAIWQNAGIAALLAKLYDMGGAGVEVYAGFQTREDIFVAVGLEAVEHPTAL